MPTESDPKPDRAMLSDLGTNLGTNLGVGLANWQGPKWLRRVDRRLQLIRERSTSRR